MVDQQTSNALLLRNLREIESIKDPAYAGFANAARNAIAEIERLQTQPARVICSGCRNEIDPETCHCGDSIKGHGYGCGHSPVPMGCDCMRSTPEPPADEAIDHAIRRIEECELSMDDSEGLVGMLQELKRLRAAQPPCVACEGKPTVDNNPCAVCGSSAAPPGADHMRMRQALQWIADEGLSCGDYAACVSEAKAALGKGENEHVSELLRNLSDALRYRRLRLLGCSAALPGATEHLARGLVLRFTNLDEFIDADLRAHPERGDSSRPTKGAGQ